MGNFEPKQLQFVTYNDLDVVGGKECGMTPIAYIL